MKEDYSKREIDHFVRDIRDTLVRIESQVVRTNGRVTSLEKWKWMMAGALTLLSFFVANEFIDLSNLTK